MPHDAQLRNTAWEALFTAHSRLMRVFQSAPIWDEVSMREYDVLYTLSKASEPMRLTALRDQVLLSQPALSRLVDRLVDRGLIHREEDPHDRRAVGLSLTAHGRDVQRSVGRRHGRDVAERMAALTPEELSQLRALCRKLGDPLAPAPAGSPPDSPRSA